MQLLRRQPVLYKVTSQILQQLRICRPLAGHSEVTGSIHDAGTEMAAPYAVHDHARADRLPHDLLRELDASASFGERLWLTRRKHAQEMSRHFGAEVVRIPADAHR